MTIYTPDTYTARLIQAFTTRENRPRVVTDTSAKGDTMLDFLLAHPSDPRRSISLEALESRGEITTCTLRFGQAEIGSRLSPDDAIAAIQEILDDHIVAVVRYKNRDTFDDCRPVAERARLFQLPDDQGEWDALMDKLSRPAGTWEKISGKYTGVFRVYRWSDQQIVER